MDGSARNVQFSILIVCSNNYHYILQYRALYDEKNYIFACLTCMQQLLENSRGFPKVAMVSFKSAKFCQVTNYKYLDSRINAYHSKFCGEKVCNTNIITLRLKNFLVTIIVLFCLFFFFSFALVNILSFYIMIMDFAPNK